MHDHTVATRHYGAIFLVALATIAIQILLSRIFSVTLYYHFAFAGITFAMLGLTAGALRVYQQPDVFSAERADHVLAEYGARFASNLALAVLLHVYAPGAILQWSTGTFVTALSKIFIVASLVPILFAFIASGVCIALLLTRFPAHTGKLYACDLGGAACGCLAIIAALMLLDPISTLLLLSLILAVMGLRFLPGNATKQLNRRVRWTGLILLLLTTVQLGTELGGTPVFRLTWAKNFVIDTPLLFERWNTYSRIAVSKYEGENPFGWGFAAKQPVSIAQKYLTIDADASTILTAFDGRLDKVRYLHNDIINLGYHIRKMDSVAVIGVGGGRDILSALIGGATRIQGIELNPAILHALTNTFGDFTGHLDKQPGVSLANAEARSYLSSHTDTYDLIQISLIDTWATTAAGGLTLSESKLYTTDAWNDFLDRLSDRGMLTISRWFDITTHPGELYRMLSIASAVITSRDPDANPRQHVLAAQVGKIATVIVSKSPLTEKEIAQFISACRRLGFTPLLTPDRAVDQIADRIASNTADAGFFAALPVDVTPSTDDKPFFFYMLRPLRMLGGEKGDIAYSPYSISSNVAIATLLVMFLITLIAGITFIASPLAKLYATYNVRFKEAAPHMLYFACIGLGFMLIEISQMQRLMIFLGHPVYGLGVVLFTLLLASSLGSYMQRNVRASDDRLWLQPALLCAVLIVIGLAMPSITEHLKYYDTGARIVASGVIIALMGFFMGMMFPIGVAVANVRHEHLLPWYWGINGAASVFASVLAVVVSLQWGISAAFWCGVVCYGACLAVLLVKSGK